MLKSNGSSGCLLTSAFWVYSNKCMMWLKHKGDKENTINASAVAMHQISIVIKKFNKNKKKLNWSSWNFVGLRKLEDEKYWGMARNSIPCKSASPHLHAGIRSSVLNTICSPELWKTRGPVKWGGLVTTMTVNNLQACMLWLPWGQEVSYSCTAVVIWSVWRKTNACV